MNDKDRKIIQLEQQNAELKKKIEIQDQLIKLTGTQYIVEDSGNNIIDSNMKQTTTNNLFKSDKIKIGDQEFTIYYYSEFAYTDSQTGLLDKTAFSVIVEFSAGRSKDDFILCVFDIDNFKSFNEIYNYSIGNVVIEGFVTLLKKYFQRKSDSIGRFGGDEYLISMKNSPLKNIVNHINSFRQEIMNHNFIEDYYKKLTGSATLSDEELEELAEFEFPNGIKVTGSFALDVYNKDESYRKNFDRVTELLHRSKDYRNAVSYFDSEKNQIITIIEGTIIYRDPITKEVIESITTNDPASIIGTEIEDPNVRDLIGFIDQQLEMIESDKKRV